MIQEITQRHFDDAFMSPGSLIFDIGGLRGDFASAMLDRGYRVVCFEPDPVGFEQIPRRPNLVVVQKAVAGVTGKRLFYQYAPCDGANGFYLNEHENAEHPFQIIEVETISLSDAISEYGIPEFVKFNCEGAEVEILLQTPDEILKQIHQLSISFHVFCHFKEMGQHEMDLCVKKLQRLGFLTTFYPEYEDECYAIRDREDITVLINGFNRPEYLKDQIAALNAQTIRPDKIIVLFTKPKKDFPVPFIDGIDFIVVENDQGLNTRFAVGLIARTKFICIMDDDIMPGKKWLESCLDIIRKEDVVISSYGIKFTDSWSDLTGLKYGDHGIHSNVPIEIDMSGHSWFMKKEWLKYFWMEESLDWTVSDDIHLSYTMRKYGKLKLVVSPYPEDNQDVWGNTMPERGLGKKSLHARKMEDIDVWGDPDKPNSWTTPEEIAYLSSNFNAFVEKRRILLEHYQKLLEI